MSGSLETICPKFAIQIRLGIWPQRVQREEIMVDWCTGETYASPPANSYALNVEANSEIGSKLGQESVKMGYLWCELPLGTLRVARLEIRIHFPGDCAKNNSTVRIFCPNYACYHLMPAKTHTNILLEGTSKSKQIYAFSQFQFLIEIRGSSSEDKGRPSQSFWPWSLI